MPRYHLVTDQDRVGGFTEFTAKDDAEARERAEDGYGRPVRLYEVEIGLVDRYREISLG